MSKTSVLRAEQQYLINQMLFNAMFTGEQPFVVFKIRRSHLLDDAIYHINSCAPHELKRPLKVVFQGEEGVDQGGLTSEFLSLLVKELIHPRFGLFTYHEDARLIYYDTADTQPIATSAVSAAVSHLRPLDPTKKDMYFIAGLVFGLALYNGVSVAANFPLALYKHLLRQTVTLEDFMQLDPIAGRSLEMVASYEGDMSELELTFEASIGTLNVNLLPVGNAIPVTIDNRLDYVTRYVDYALNTLASQQIDNFVNGFRSICDGRAIKLFTAMDLELVLVGTPNLNFADLEQTARYEGGYSASQPTIKQFWEVLNELNPDEKRAFLQFTTGSSRSPLGGLSQLRLLIQRAGPDTENLPTGHTCFHAILLPEYASKQKMEKKIKLALLHGQEGFGLQ